MVDRAATAFADASHCTGQGARPRRAPGRATSAVLGPRRLLLLGGGPRPVEAMQRFSAWAGGPLARVLVVAWASSEPWQAIDALTRDLEPHGAFGIDASPRPPVTSRERARFLEQAANATAVLFTGGDQARIMDALDADLARALRDLHRQGVPFGGTSAGTAIMSPRMIASGDTSARLRTGLALLPGTIVDQHFLLRGRERRLHDAVRRHPLALGIGIDDGAALIVEGSRRCEVVGGRVALVRATGERWLQVLEAGARFDLLDPRS